MSGIDPRDLTAIGRVLEQLGRRPADARISPLGGGITNKNFRVEVGGASWVVRLGGTGTAELGIDRRREEVAMRAAAALGVGAEVVHVDPEAEVTVTRFIEGTPLEGDDAARPETLVRVASALRVIHGAPAIDGEFSPFSTVRDYGARARAHGVSLPDEAAPALSIMDRVEAALGAPERTTPCHNDLLPANLLDDGTRIRVIDWEYAAMGDPLFDLGNFAVNAGLGEAQARVLLVAYAGACTPRRLARLSLMRVASDLREGFWGVLQQGISRLDFDFAGYAAKHLARVVAAGERPAFEADLLAARL